MEVGQKAGSPRACFFIERCDSVEIGRRPRYISRPSTERGARPVLGISRLPGELVPRAFETRSSRPPERSHRQRPLGDDGIIRPQPHVEHMDAAHALMPRERQRQRGRLPGLDGRLTDDRLRWSASCHHCHRRFLEDVQDPVSHVHEGEHGGDACIKGQIAEVDR